jgi:histidinol-phosphate aminotransferase
MSVIRPEINTLHEYKPGIRPTKEMHRLRVAEGAAKLAGNENPWPPFPETVEAICEAARGLNRYPDQTYSDLKEALGEAYGVPAGQIVVSNGAVPLIRLAGDVALRPGDEVIVAWPPYPNYLVVAGLAGATTIKLPAKNGAMDLRATLEHVTPRTRMVFCANPHNPTGSIVPPEDMHYYFDNVPDHVLTVMDEAYVDFVTDPPNYPDSRAFLNHGKPLLGLRTFSKVYSLAGLRLGFGHGTPEVISAIEKTREVHMVSSVAVAAGLASLKRQDLMRQRIQTIVEGREQLKAIADNLGLTYTPSQANFLWMDVRRNSRTVLQELMKRGVIVRSGEVHDCLNWIRVSVGMPDELQKFAVALEEVLEEIPEEVAAAAAV